MRAEATPDAVAAAICVLCPPVGEGLVARRVDELERVEGDRDAGREGRVGETIEEAGTKKRDEVVGRKRRDARREVRQVGHVEGVELDGLTHLGRGKGVARHLVCAVRVAQPACVACERLEGQG